MTGGAARSAEELMRLRREDEVVRAHRGWVQALARRFLRGGTTLTLADLEQLGLEGLLIAHRKYNPKRAPTGDFRDFARRWVLGAMMMAQREERRHARLRQGMRAVMDEVAIEASAVPNRVEVLVTALERNVLAFLMSQHEDGALEAEAQSPESRAMIAERRTYLLELMERLPPRRRDFLRMRYFEHLGIQKIASMWEVDKTTVSKLGKEAEIQLRNLMTEREG